MRLSVKNESGRASLQLINDGREVIGMGNMSWTEYEAMVRAVARSLIDGARTAIAKSLGDRVWKDAITRNAMSENSAELAQGDLTKLGWNAETIQSYADELARAVAETMIQKLPEHR